MHSNHLYFEAGYDLSESLNIFAGYLTDRNDLMFTNKGGWNAIGASISKKLNVCHQTSLLKVSVVANPTSVIPACTVERKWSGAFGGIDHFLKNKNIFI